MATRRPGADLPAFGPQKLTQFYQDQTWLKGAHDIRFGGAYVLSSASHIVRSSRGYETRFTVSPGPARPLGHTTGDRREWRHTSVVGQVTNNQDPDELGRVRVTYPALGTDHEGWWARVAGAAAGGRRGVLMMPQAGDEVLLGFEHDDEERPVVLGSVWNGEGKPQEMSAEGLLATCLQHEIDHLNGVLFIDHISKLKRDMVVKKFKKLAKDRPPTRMVG